MPPGIVGHSLHRDARVTSPGLEGNGVQPSPFGRSETSVAGAGPTPAITETAAGEDAATAVAEPVRAAAVSINIHEWQRERRAACLVMLAVIGALAIALLVLGLLGLHAVTEHFSIH